MAKSPSGVQAKHARKATASRPNNDSEGDLRTGSLAPVDIVNRTLEEGIGAEVRRLRKSLDLTVAELGTAAGISAGMLSKIENASISPSLATLDALAKALNVPVSRLFAESEDRRDCSFVKAGSGVRIERRGTKAGHRYDLLGHSLAGVAHFLHVSPGLLLLSVLPHAIPELVALFLPLAAWIIASRKGEWEQLLAATFVTVALAVPVLVVAAIVEVYVSPHLFGTLTHIHPPIVRSSEGWIVTVR